MSVLQAKPKFLYPYLRQFPFDEVAEKIVKAMEKRNWKVPGITVKFDTYGSGEEQYKLVREITGGDFKLYFCRVQENSRARCKDAFWKDTAALYSVHIPKQAIEVSVDESGPTYYLYVGDNWEQDKNWFINSHKVNAKGHREPRRYLRYRGDNPYPYSNSLAKVLFAVGANDPYGREYSPIGNEPRFIYLEDKFKEFTSWLEDYVLNYILDFPEATIVEDDPIDELIPYQGPWTTVFSMCDTGAAVRIMSGKKYPKSLIPALRHASFGNARRLVPLLVSCNGRFPETAYNGFIWCDTNPNITPNSSKSDISLCVASEMSSWDPYLVAIKLKYANDVYVADNAKYEEMRHQLFESIAPRDGLPDDELLAARGATIVPITEYKGDYKEPIVLINRALDFEEIEWLTCLYSM